MRIFVHIALLVVSACWLSCGPAYAEKRVALVIGNGAYKHAPCLPNPAMHAGTIAACVGNPGAAPKWQWRCGFYPGSRPGECTNGTADTLEIAGADFEAAWRVFLAKRTEADFQAWREQQAWTAEKYRRFDRGERMPAGWNEAMA